MSIQWSADGDDLTVPEGAFAAARDRAVRDRSPCTILKCPGHTGGHASAFRHLALNPDKATRKKSADKAKAYRATRRRLQESLDKARGAQEPYPMPVLVPSKSRLVVYSKTPWAWTVDRKGNPKPLGA